MKYEVTYKCGHVGEVDLFGKNADRERKLAYLATLECPECEHKHAEETAKENGLVELQGSEKQIGWAESVRVEKIANAEKELEVCKDKAMVAKFMAWLKAQNVAGWWIDHRYDNTRSLCREFMANAKKVEETEETAVETVEKTVEETEEVEETVETKEEPAAETYGEEIDRIVKTEDVLNGDDETEKLIAMAFAMGVEKATKQISDQYTALLAGQRERAEGCRYYNMVNKVLGDVNPIYSPDYRGDVTKEFAGDKLHRTVGVTEKIKEVMSVAGVNGRGLAGVLKTTPQNATNKITRGVKSIADLIKIVDYCGGKIEITDKNGNVIPLNLQDL